jgi:cytochrome c
MAKPAADASLDGNTLIPYAIEVNDQEDGNSAYEEINGREVVLLVKYLESSAWVEGYLARIEEDLAPVMAMAKSTCLNCHAASSKLIGPSFDLLANKYSARDNAKVYLTDKVMSGSTGTWGEEKMPPQPDLNKEEVGLIVDWILAQKGDPTFFYIGLEGAIRTPETPSSASKAVGVLTAAYEDHGSANAPDERKLGRQTIILEWRQ